MLSFSELNVADSMRDLIPQLSQQPSPKRSTQSLHLKTIGSNHSYQDRVHTLHKFLNPTKVERKIP